MLKLHWFNLLRICCCLTYPSTNDVRGDVETSEISQLVSARARMHRDRNARKIGIGI